MAREMSIPQTNSFEHISELVTRKVKGRGAVRAAVILTGATRGFGACTQAAQQGLIAPVVIGTSEDIQRTIKGTFLKTADTIEAADIVASVSVAMKLALDGKTDLILADERAADAALAALRAGEAGFVPKGGVASSVAVLKPERYRKLLLLSDCAVCAAPDLRAKLGIIQNMVGVARSIEMGSPRIAVLAAVEVVYPQMPVTMEGAVLAKMAERQQIKGAMVDGPLSFDVAMDDFAATSKGITQSPVAGQADAFLAPNVEVASGVYSALSLFGSCERGAIIVGGAVPIAITMRTDSATEMLNSIYLGILGA